MTDINSAIAKAMIESILEDDEETSPPRAPEIEARRMLDFYQDLQDKTVFKPGDLVCWKQGLKNGKYPLAGYPAVVSRVYETPVVREDMESGSNHFREPLDMVILVDTSDEVSEFHVDSRRFQAYEGKVVGKADTEGDS